MRTCSEDVQRVLYSDVKNVIVDQVGVRMSHGDNDIEAFPIQADTNVPVTVQRYWDPKGAEIGSCSRVRKSQVPEIQKGQITAKPVNAVQNTMDVPERKQEEDPMVKKTHKTADDCGQSQRPQLFKRATTHSCDSGSTEGLDCLQVCSTETSRPSKDAADIE